MRGAERKVTCTPVTGYARGVDFAGVRLDPWVNGGGGEGNVDEWNPGGVD